MHDVGSKCGSDVNGPDWKANILDRKQKEAKVKTHTCSIIHITINSRQYAISNEKLVTLV